MATQAGDVQIHPEAWVKHTSGGEMPDPSTLGSARRRISAAASAIGGELQSSGSTWVPLALAVVAMGLGAYFLWDRFGDVPEDRRSAV